MELREKVESARRIQQDRYKDEEGISCNAQMTTSMIQKYCELDADSLKLLKETSEKYGYSARVIHKLLRLARTSADLDGVEKIRKEDIEKVLSCRDLDESNSKMIYWIWLTQIPQVDPVLSNRLLEKFKIPVEIYRADHEALQLVKGISNRQIEGILCSRSLDKSKGILDVCNKKKISILTNQDSRYPFKAKMLEDAPVILYYQGCFADLSHSVGIVGAKRCNQEVKKQCVQITQSYVRQGIPIVSGMAKGIDACAATACINEGGYTVAVLGNGLDTCYPSEHQLLMDKIREKGLLISEYPPGTRPTRYNFPKRNRLINAWSDKVIIIAPGKGGGALITGDYAKKYGREIEIIGGAVTPQTRQTGNRLSSNAEIVYSWDNCDAIFFQ